MKARSRPMSCLARGIARKEVRSGKEGVQAGVEVGARQGTVAGGAGVARCVEEREEEVALTSRGRLTSTAAWARELRELLKVAAVHVFLEYIISREEEEGEGRGKTWEREEKAEGREREVVQEERARHAVVVVVGGKKCVIFPCSSAFLSLLVLSLAFFPLLLSLKEKWGGRGKRTEGWIAGEEVGAKRVAAVVVVRRREVTETVVGA